MPTTMNLSKGLLWIFRVCHRSDVGRLQAELSSTTALTVKKQIKSRLQCARRMQGIFWPSDRRHRLTGIKSADGSIITCPSMVQKELADHWGPIYQKKPIDLTAAKTLLGFYSRKHGQLINGFRFCILPNSEVFCNIIKRVKDSAPGPDGIPYSALAACIETSSVILANTSDYFLLLRMFRIWRGPTSNMFGFLRKENWRETL